MTGPAKTQLPTPQRVKLAAAAYAAQGVHGAVTRLAEGFDVSRPTVYEAAAMAEGVLTRHFEAGERTQMVVDRAQVQRAVVALRAIAPNSLRAIQELVPTLYPGVQLSYGAIQAMTVQASDRAKHFNRQADLSQIVAGAVDEMFSQGAPVLAGVDLDSGYLFALELKESRSAADWAQTFEVGKSQGLDLKVVVKDAASGIEAGVREAFPDAQSRDDCFHALYIMGKEHQRLERKGYGAIGQVEDIRTRLAQCRRTGRGDRRKLSAELRKATHRCDRVLETHDRFEEAAREVQEALWFIDVDKGALRTQPEMQSMLEAAAAKMVALTDQKSRKVGRYLNNRAPGLACYLEELQLHLDALASTHGENAVRLACIITRLAMEVREHRRPWHLTENTRALQGACILLQQHAGEDAQTLYDMVQIALQHSHRASSAIEGFNAALRPHLYVHKGVNQEFLELFRARYNLRTRRWGRHKGTSPHEGLTGHRVVDWLTMLGYPPSDTLH